MPIIQCNKGHRYDNTRFKQCPFCKSASKTDLQKKGGDPSSFLGASIGLMESTIERTPVVGWVVCMEGPEKGRDYRIKSGRNRVGRSWKMDISLTKDPEIMSGEHTSIIYTAQNGIFQLMPIDGAKVFRNDELVTQETPLAENDQIRLGSSILVFVPFCKPGRQWDIAPF